MKSLVRVSLLLTLALILASPLSAADEKKKKKEAAKGKDNAAAARGVNFPKGIEPSSEQKEALKKLQAEFGPQLAALAQKQRELLTDEQRKAVAEARKQAAQDGKKGAEAKKTLEAVINLTPEQKKQQAEILAARKELGGKVNAAILALLTDEQKAQLPQRKKPAKAEAPKKPKSAQPKKTEPKKAKAAE